MTYETISVRMNRSDRNIRWGFSVRQQADGLIIDRVEAESLSDKAGVKHNDKVDQINGRSTRGLDAASANRLIDDSFNEVRLSLQRFVTSHTTLPWTLNEKDNKMVVEEMKPGFGTGFGSGFGSSNFVNSSFNQNQNNFGSHFGTGSGVNQRNITNTNTSSSNHQSSTFHSSSHQSSGNYGSGGFSPSSHHNIPIRHSPAPPFTTSNSSYNNIKKSTDNTILPGSANYNPNNSSNYNSVPTGFGASSGGYGGSGGFKGHSNGSAIPAQAPPTSYSYNNGATSQPYGAGSGGTPLNQMTFINTSPAPGANGAYGAQCGLSPSKVFYHSPSGRSRNELSPGAAVHHLQYNSPMNLYSSEATAEQLYQQTGAVPEGPVPHDKSPAYLTSETRKLIEEEARGRFQRGKSPSSQSSCFKRISHAVGADH
ncbi:PDZ domain-containing protein [Caenorhabditis elegans]|nr:PDZ domain-containing protein [Caenorhabditis elegans]CAA88478.2 PDZ domain-containing protein [Caenorhabditis elegans]|eukprot:NP_001254227.1 Uncharacterized protein CELE_ZK1321.4 [Caenorhabditis elegans]